MSTQEFFEMVDGVLTAGSARELQTIKNRLKSIPGILDTERRQIEAAINRRFSQLNAAEVGAQKGRWV